MAGQIDEIKAKVDVVDLVSEYIRLKPAGGTNFRALCPFHNEKTPSFMVSRDKQFWHCFGCNESGDIFTFIQKMEGLEFIEALRLLAQKAGVKLVSQNPELTNQKNRLLDICLLAANFWHRQLLEAPLAQKARDYLGSRQVDEKTIADFKIGYAQDSWDALIKFLKSKNFSDQEIFLAGLSVKKERGVDFYDRFRDRLMFPLNDLHGNPIGFTGRTLKADETGGKYINTPQTILYNKSLVLFNLDKAKQEIKKQDLAIIVEGQMDAISTYEAGSRNVIASSGTALTSDQIRILKRYSNNIAIAFDADLAGDHAAKRGIDLALAEEMNVKVILTPEGKDPDECIKNNPALWFEAVKNAKSIMEYYFDQTFSRVDSGSAEGKKQAAKILLPVIGKIGSKIEQSHWLQKLASRLNVSEQILREALPRPANFSAAITAAAPAPMNQGRNVMIPELILAIVLNQPQNLIYLIDNFEPKIIAEAGLQRLYKELIIYYTEDIGSQLDNFDYQKFHNKINDDFKALAGKLLLLGQKDFFDFEAEAVRDELSKLINAAKRNFYNTRLKEIEEKIRVAENNNQIEEMQTLLEQFNEVVGQVSLLE